MKKITLLFLFVMAPTTIFASSDPISAKAIWQISKPAMEKIMDCLKEKTEKSSECIIKVMRKNDASSEAREFTKELDSRNFMQSFEDFGPIDVVRTHAIAADYSEGYYLVNGNPRIIDINDLEKLNKLDFKALPEGKSLLKKYPNAFLTQVADYSFTLQKHSQGGRSFIFIFPIKDGCKACDIIGYADVAFNFDQNNNFLGMSLKHVRNTTQK
jgi:hypothetical protein